MLIMDIPDNPPQAMHVALQTTAEQRMPSEADLQSLYGSMGVCVNSPTLENMRIEEKGLRTDAFYAKGYPLWPRDTALNNLEDRDEVDVQLAADTASVFVLQKPKHGTVVTSEAGFNYLPDSGYEGKDQVVFLVNIDGRVVKTIYYLKVFDSALNKGEENIQKRNNLFKVYCPKEKTWKISRFIPDGVFLIGYNNSSAIDLKSLPINFLGFDNLPASTLAQTTGTGLNATITFDTNAASYGWFLNNTPSLTEDMDMGALMNLRHTLYATVASFFWLKSANG